MTEKTLYDALKENDALPEKDDWSVEEVNDSTVCWIHDHSPALVELSGSFDYDIRFGVPDDAIHAGKEDSMLNAAQEVEALMQAIEVGRNITLQELRQ